MNQQNWYSDIDWDDKDIPFDQGEEDSEVYTLHLSDFLRMPLVDYKELALVDPYIKSLFN